MIDKIKKFFEETRLEFRHVNWPSRNEAARLTMVVVILSLCLAAFLGAFDYLFTYLLRIFVVKT
ncbi:MAG: preprotein translocase subunit SecE [Candidatus Liptonbacteria bacterium]|nr:preprotein translocase subunit SecE [Candidatus Liptonbacteria bacterium]